MNKYLYKIKDLEIPPWIKYWFLRKSKINFDLSQILSGTSFDLENSVNKKLHLINVYGNSEQETRSGKNRIKLIAGGSDARNGITATVNNDLSITLNGTATEDTSINFSRLGATIDNDVINGNTLSVFFVSGTWTTSNSTKSAFRIYNSSFSLGLIVNQLNTLSNNNRVRYSTYQNNDLQVNNWNTSFFIPEGDTLDNFTVKLMLTDEVDTEYEDYGAMPSPDYPSEIKSTGDNGYIVEKFVNKNLLKLEELHMITNTQGVIENTTIHRSVLINVSKINSLCITGNFSYLESTLIRVGLFYEYPFIGLQGTRTNATRNNNVIDTTDYNYILLTFVRASNITYEDIEKSFQIEQGSTATDYEPHQEQVFTIPCQQPMRAIGNVKDTFVKVNGVWYERHNITRISSYNGEEITTAYMSTTGELSTGATVDYVLTTPTDLICTTLQITALEQLQKAKTYKGVTHIYSDDEVPANLEIQYYKEKEEQ